MSNKAIDKKLLKAALEEMLAERNPELKGVLEEILTKILTGRPVADRATQLDSKDERKFSLFATDNNTLVSIVTVGEIRSLAFQFGWGVEKMDRMNRFLHALNPYPVDN